jgi:hypothetical protein
MLGEILAGSGSAVAVGMAVWSVARSKVGDATATAEHFAALAERLTVVETKIALYWEAVASQAARLLHSPHPEHARRDWLLEHYQTLTLLERAELAQALESIQHDPAATAGDQIAAAQLLGYLAGTGLVGDRG